MKRNRMKQLVSFGLAVPGLLMVWDVVVGGTWPMDMLHPSGEMSIRLMVLAMLPGPLVEIMGTNRILRGWLMIRRNLGLAAFGYALLHLVFYLADMTPAGIINELGLPGILTGWLAFAVLLVPASISFNAAVLTLGRRWKSVQRLVYLAFALAIVHWLLLGWSVLPALVHAAPLILVWIGRGWKRHQIRKETPTP